MKKWYVSFWLMFQVICASEQDCSQYQLEIDDMMASLSLSLPHEELHQRTNDLQARKQECHNYCQVVAHDIAMMNKDIDSTERISLIHYNSAWLKENARQINNYDYFQENKDYNLAVIKNVELVVASQLEQKIDEMQSMKKQHENFEYYQKQYDAVYLNYSKLLFEKTQLQEKSAIIIQNLTRQLIAKNKRIKLQQLMEFEKNRYEEQLKIAIKLQERKELQRQANQERQARELEQKNKEILDKKLSQELQSCLDKQKAQAQKNELLAQQQKQAEQDDDFEKLIKKEQELILHATSKSRYIDFRSKIEQLKKHRHDHQRMLMRKHISDIELQKNMILFDKEHGYYDIKNLIEEYQGFVCSDIETVDIQKLQRSIARIINFHKDVQSQNEYVSWYVYFYPEVYKKIEDRFKVLTDELKDQSEKAVTYLKFINKHNCDFLITELAQLQKTMKTAVESKNKDEMRIIVAQIKEKQDQVEIVKKMLASCELMHKKLAMYQSMKMVQGLGGALDIFGSPADTIELVGTLSDAELHQNFLLLKNQVKEMIVTQGSSLKLQDVTDELFKQQVEHIDVMISSLVHGLFLKIKLSDEDAMNLSFKLIESAKHFAQMYADGVMDMQNFNRRLYQKFMMGGEKDYSHAQMSDVLNIQMAMIEFYAHIMDDKF